LSEKINLQVTKTSKISPRPATREASGWPSERTQYAETTVLCSSTWLPPSGKFLELFGSRRPLWQPKGLRISSQANASEGCYLESDSENTPLACASEAGY
jgi:hypothetical protein